MRRLVEEDRPRPEADGREEGHPQGLAGTRDRAMRRRRRRPPRAAAPTPTTCRAWIVLPSDVDAEQQRDRHRPDPGDRGDQPHRSGSSVPRYSAATPTAPATPALADQERGRHRRGLVGDNRHAEQETGTRRAGRMPPPAALRRGATRGRRRSRPPRTRSRTRHRTAVPMPGPVGMVFRCNGGVEAVDRATLAGRLREVRSDTARLCHPVPVEAPRDGCGFRGTLQQRTVEIGLTCPASRGRVPPPSEGRPEPPGTSPAGVLDRPSRGAGGRRPDDLFPQCLHARRGDPRGPARGRFASSSARRRLSQASTWRSPTASSSRCSGRPARARRRPCG